jgi:replicative DNA helicase
LEFAAKNNSNLEQYIKDIWINIQNLNVDHREYSFILSKINKRYNLNILKHLHERLVDLDEDSIENTNDLLYKITSEIKNIGERRIYKEISLSTYVQEWKDLFIARAKNPEIAQGILTGFSILDYYTNGMRPGELFCIGGASGSGKSIFLIDLAVNMYMGKNKMPDTFEELVDIVENNKWKKGINILFLSLEMPASEIADRILSNMAGVSTLDITKGKIKQSDIENIKKALYFWENSPNTIKIIDVPRGCTCSDIQKIYEEAILEKPYDCVIVDYLGLMKNSNPEDANSDWLAMKKNAEELHEFCRYNNICAWTALQLTQNEKQGSGGVGVHRINRSKAIIQDLNLFLMIEDREDEPMRADSKIHCLKFRRGSLFVMNNLRKEFQFARFSDLGFNENEDKEGTNLAQEDLSSFIDQIFGKDEEENIKI